MATTADLWAHVTVDGDVDGLTPTPPGYRVYEEEPDGMGQGRWREATAEELAATGWHPVTRIARPDNTDTTTFDSTVEATMVDDEVVDVHDVWTERPWTQPELDRRLRRQVQTELAADPETHVDALLATIEALKVLRARSNADINQNIAAAIKEVVDANLVIARRLVRLYRLAGQVFDSADVG